MKNKDKTRLGKFLRIKVLSALILLSALAAPLTSCSDSSSSASASDSSVSSGASTASPAAASAAYPSNYNASDYNVGSVDFGTEYTFDVQSKAWFGNAPDDDNYVIKAKNLKVTATNVRLTGANSTYKVTIYGNSQPVKVTLDSLALESPDRCLNIKDSQYTYIYLEGNNSLETAAQSEDKNVLKSHANLIIDGDDDATLSVTADSKNGIVCDAVMCIKGGTLSVTVAEETSSTDEDTGVVERTKGTAVKPYLGFVMTGGTLNLYGNGSDDYYESKGLKVEGYDQDEVDDNGYADGYSANYGWIVIDGGTINATTQGKAISAGWTSDDGAPASSANYPVPDVYINGGTLTITTKHAPRDDSSSTADDGVSPEGIEAKHNVYINGGTFVINTTDDCINAKNAIYINGGLIYALSSSNDSIDAGADENEGYLYITGGTTVAMGHSSPETGIDCNSNSRFTYTGGTFIGMGGGTNSAPAASGTTGHYVNTTNLTRGAKYALKYNNTVVLAFAVPSGYSYASNVIIGAEGLGANSATLVSSPTITGGTLVNNGTIYTGSFTVSGGSSTAVTGSAASGMGGGAAGPGSMNGAQGGFSGRH